MDRSLSKLLEIVKDREDWRAAGHGVAKNQTQLSDFHYMLWNLRRMLPFGLRSERVVVAGGGGGGAQKGNVTGLKSTD